MKLISKKTLQPFDWFLICGSIVLYAVLFFLSPQFSMMGAVAGVTGLICNVLCAKRNVLNYLFGVVNVSLYAWISWQNSIYGDFILNALYYLPMNVIGFFVWMRRRTAVTSENEDDTAVRSRRMSSWQRVLLIGASALLVLGTGWILQHYTSDPQPYKDAATTVVSIIAMLLMVMTFMEQWWLWIFVNVLGVMMWIIICARGGESSAEMVIMWLFYLANSINGYLVWSRAARHSEGTGSTF